MSTYTHCLYQPPLMAPELAFLHILHRAKPILAPGAFALALCSSGPSIKFLKLCPAQASHTLAEQLFPEYCPVASPSEVPHSSFSEMPVHMRCLIDPRPV